MIIFDCDGVLVDSEILSCETDARLMRTAGHQITTEDIIHRFIGRPKHVIWAELAEERGQPWPMDLLQRADEILLERLRTELKPVRGVVDALQKLDLLRAVASSSGVTKLKLSLEVCGLSDFFGHHIYSAEQVARGKPAPDVFLLAASQLGADPADCLVIEDSAAGVTAARRAGMQALGFTGGRHTWPAHAARLRDAGAIDVITHMEMLPGKLADWQSAA